MGYWRREEELFQELAPDRQANIEVVLSAYQSVTVDKSYLTMPVTTGRLFYDVLDRYGVKTVEELERKRPGALREEIILPNIEQAKAFAESFDRSIWPLVVPGVFEARRQRWSQDEYMILWLRLLTSSVQELYLSPDWEYSSGGAMEFCRGLMIQFRFIKERPLRLPIFDLQRNKVGIEEGSWKLASAIKDLTSRGYDTTKLRSELSQIAGISAYVYDWLTDRHDYAVHTDGIPHDSRSVIRAAESVGVRIAFDPNH